MTEKKRDAHLATIPTVNGGEILVFVGTDGLICLKVPNGIPWALEEGPALVLGGILQLAVQAAQAQRARKATTF